MVSFFFFFDNEAIFKLSTLQWTRQNQFDIVAIAITEIHNSYAWIAGIAGI